MIQVFLTLIFYIIMVGILVMVFLMWRTGERTRHSGEQEREKLIQTIINASLQSAMAAKEAAEAVHLLAQKERDTREHS